MKSKVSTLDGLLAIQKKIDNIEEGELEAESYDFRCEFPYLFPGSPQSSSYIGSITMPYLPHTGDLFRVRKGNLIYEGGDQVTIVGISSRKPVEIIRLPATIRGIDIQAIKIGSELDETGIFIVTGTDGRQPIIEKITGTD